MNSFTIASAAFVIVFSAGCEGLTTLPPAGPSSTFALTASPVASGAAPALVSQHIVGSAGPLREGSPPCFADRYSCEVYVFSLLQEGPIEVAIAWEGAPRALMVQLYWAGEGLAHEDVAPINGPSRIDFRRPRMEATNYLLRVVNMEPTRTIPFTLTLTH